MIYMTPPNEAQMITIEARFVNSNDHQVEIRLQAITL
jgi:hypothetical protein